MQDPEEPDEHYAWYQTWIEHPQRSITATAHYHQVPYRDVLRCAARWRWKHRATRDVDTVAPAQAHPADVPAWSRPAGWSPQRWAWFSTWLQMPSHDLSLTAKLHDVPEWVIRAAYRRDGWQERLDAWCRERARTVGHVVDTAEAKIKADLMTTAQQLSTQVRGWIEAAGRGKDPARAVDAYHQMVRLAREITVNAPPEPIAHSDMGGDDYVLAERAQTAAQLRQVERALIAAAISGDREAAQTLVLVSGRRAALTGLDTPPVTKAQALADHQAAGETAALLEEYVQRTARELAEQMIAERDAQTAEQDHPKVITAG